MKMKNTKEFHPKPGKALLKLLVILAAAGGVLAALVMVIDDQTLETLKHTLSVTTIILLVIIANLVSFICVMVIYALYEWIRCDLKPPRADYPDGD